MNKSTEQKVGTTAVLELHSNIGHYVPMNSAVIPIATDKIASAEAKSYILQRADPNNYVCIHEGIVYVISITGDTIGGSCEDYASCEGNEVCKHLAAFLKRSRLPTAKLSKEVANLLLNAGWVAEDGGLHPPIVPVSEKPESIPPAPADPISVDEDPITEGTVDQGSNDVNDAANDTVDPTVTAPNEGKLATEGIVDPTVNTPNEATKDTVDPVGKDINDETPPTESTSEPEGDANSNDNPVPEDPIVPIPAPPPTSVVDDVATDPIIANIITTAEAAGAKDIDPEWVREKLMDLKQFKVVGTIASQSVVGLIFREQNIKRPKSERGGTNALVTLDSIAAPDKWVSIRGKVVALWDNENESIRQVGLVGDETGTRKFVSWEKAGLEMLEKDRNYSIQNVVTHEYEGMFSVALTRNTQITLLDEDIEVAYTTAEFTGAMVNIQEGSGLIKRCSVCNRAMKQGMCKEHDKVEGVYDMRIKGVLDNGRIAQDVLFSREPTEAMSGITLEAAIALAMDAMDAEVVAENIQDMLVGHEFTVTGRAMGDTLLVESVTECTTPVSEEDIHAFVKEV